EAYRLEGTEWTALDLPFPDGVRWMSFAGGDGRLYGGAYSRGAWTAPLSLSPVEFLVLPVDPPIVVPAGGGAFAFDVTLFNLSLVPVTVEVWTDVDGPVSRSPVLGP